MSDNEGWKIEGYGWHPSRPDARDEPYALSFRLGLSTGPLPRFKLLIDQMPPIWNQAKLGSCTAHGVLADYCAARKKAGMNVFMPSRLLQYYNSRWLEHTTLIDAGATCRDAIKAIAKWGACDESLWPYDISKFNRKAPDRAYIEAEKHQAVQYAAIAQDLSVIKATLAAGFPIVFGFTVYQNFSTGSTPRTGLMFMPEGRAEGGHCVCAVGYNSHNYICCRNSWGTKFGDPDLPGHFWMPPEYVLHPQLAADFWTIQATEV